MQRYRFFREHKFVTHALAQFEQSIATTDFTEPLQVEAIQTQLAGLTGMLFGHAKHEDHKIFVLLKKRGSHVQDALEGDHKELEKQLQVLEGQLKTMNDIPINKREEAGYYFYLTYREFHARNLSHMYAEETIVMPELWRLYPDDEDLRAVDRKVYGEMTPEQMAEMLSHLFPRMNKSDQEFFFDDLKRAEPEKYAKARMLFETKTRGK